MLQLSDQHYSELKRPGYSLFMTDQTDKCPQTEVEQKQKQTFGIATVKGAQGLQTHG